MDFKKNIKLILVAIICVSFFLPWISVESAAVGGVTKILTGKKQATLDTISGFKVPVLANSDESRFMIAIIKIFQPNIKDADKKSYLIWIVPLLSVLFFWLSNTLDRNKWVKLGIAVVGITIFSFATFKILTTDLDKLVMKVNIAYGLWAILLGYLGIGLVELMAFLKLNKK